MIKRLPDNCLSLYADLLQKTIESQHAVLGGGSFVSKSIKGAVYWYYQTKIGGETKQKYIGRESESLLKDIEQAKAPVIPGSFPATAGQYGSRQEFR